LFAHQVIEVFHIDEFRVARFKSFERLTCQVAIWFVFFPDSAQGLI